MTYPATSAQSPVRTIPIREIADWLHSRSNPWKALALLKAYFDESGTHEDSRITMISGYVGNVDVWVGVERRWLDTLSIYRDLGLKTFHMADCRTGHGEFQNIQSHLREAITTGLSDTLAGADLQAIWSGVNVTDWDAVTDGYPKFRERFPKPYDWCFNAAVRQLYLWAKNARVDGPIPVMFAVNDHHMERGRDIYDAWRRYGDADRYLGALAFDYPSRVVPLQTADMIANESYHQWRELEFGSVTAETNFGYRTLWRKIAIKRGLAWGGLYEERSLKNVMTEFSRGEQPS